MQCIRRGHRQRDPRVVVVDEYQAALAACDQPLPWSARYTQQHATSGASHHFPAVLLGGGGGMIERATLREGLGDDARRQVHLDGGGGRATLDAIDCVSGITRLTNGAEPLAPNAQIASVQVAR